MKREITDKFSYQDTKSGSVLIYCGGKVAKTIKGNAAAKFLQKAQDLNAESMQLLMARETGQFKFGNERSSER